MRIRRFCDELFEKDLDKRVDLIQVYESLEAAIDVVCDQDTQNAIADEYCRQIRLWFQADAREQDNCIAKPQEFYRGTGTELKEVQDGN